MRHVRRVLLLIVCIVCTVWVFDSLSFDSLTVKNNSQYILSSRSKSTVILDTDNTVYTNLAGLSNCVNAYLSKGYIIYQAVYKPEYIDIIIQNNEEGIVYRYYYDYLTKRLTSFCNNYEDSYKALTYINE